MKDIREELNVNYEDLDDVPPIICGTVIQGGFNRKLKMLRADLYSMLAVSASN